MSMNNNWLFDEDGYPYEAFPGSGTWFVNRWYDADGIPHYHGVIARWDTLVEGQANIVFNVLDVPVDLVYGPCSLAELYEYLHDVLVDTEEE